MKIVALIFAWAIALLGCSAEPPPPVAVTASSSQESSPPRGPRDYGDLQSYQSCSATPRRALTEIEMCEIKALSRTCNPVTDCLVTCMSSPDGHKVGGGCYHICFGAAGGHSWQDRPSSEIFKECATLEPPADG
jgi:hypothetical protein